MSSTSKVSLITIDRLRERLEVDFDNGRLYYKPIGLSWWDTVNSGRECFKLRCGNYLQGNIDRVRLYKHRVILAMYLGRWPIQVDHINGRTFDNRILNLREVTYKDNRKNCAKHIKNSSGHNGVTWSKDQGKWLARICVNYKEINLGVYTSLDEAVRVREEANKKYGFHKNHGRDRTTKV